MNGIFATVNQGGRLAEWGTTGIMLGLAVVLALDGNTFAAPAFAGIVQWIGGEAMVAVPLAIIGTARVAALLVNGRLPGATSCIRGVGALIGALVFLVMAYLFALPYSTGATAAPSTAIATYGVLALLDLASAWRATYDAFIPRQH